MRSRATARIVPPPRFNATAEALEQRVLRDARFAGDVSHELRSPLTTMVNAAEVLRRRADLHGPAAQALDLLMDRVVTNLLDNAERHAGGAVRIAVLHHDTVVRLEVDDARPGIPHDLRDRIFDRFARGTRSGRRGTDTGSTQFISR